MKNKLELRVLCLCGRAKNLNNQWLANTPKSM